MSTLETVCSFLCKKGLTKRQTKVCHKSIIKKEKIMLLYRGAAIDKMVSIIYHGCRVFAVSTVEPCSSFRKGCPPRMKSACWLKVQQAENFVINHTEPCRTCARLSGVSPCLSR